MASKKVRILGYITLDGREYAPNQVVSIEESKVKHAIKDGLVDASKAAVDYCLQELGAEVIVHDVPAADSAPATGDVPADQSGGAADQTALQV